MVHHAKSSDRPIVIIVKIFFHEMIVIQVRLVGQPGPRINYLTLRIVSKVTIQRTPQSDTVLADKRIVGSRRVRGLLV